MIKGNQEYWDKGVGNEKEENIKKIILKVQRELIKGSTFLVNKVKGYEIWEKSSY